MDPEALGQEEEKDPEERDQQEEKEEAENLVSFILAHRYLRNLDCLMVWLVPKVATIGGAVSLSKLKFL